jgi:hypothetical protein
MKSYVLRYTLLQSHHTFFGRYGQPADKPVISRNDGSQAQDYRLAQRGERLQTRVNHLVRQLAALPD